MSFEVIDNVKEDRKKFSDKGYGETEIVLTEHEFGYMMDSLINGKAIGIFNGEYTTVITLKYD